MFRGSCVALVTPMTAKGAVDESTLVNLVEWHVKNKTAAIVVSGSTGEAATLTAKEQENVIALVYQTVKKRVPVIAGTGTNSTATTITRTISAQKIGVDACLIVTPYYNRPTQQGLVEHYSTIAKSVDVPIILYNVPSRTSCDLLPETVATLSTIKGIMGIKEATGSMQRLAALQQCCRKDFIFYSGDDPSCFTFMQNGGGGVISITANVAPHLMQKLCQHVVDHEFEKAKAIDDRLQALHRLLIIESNPIPIKWALHYLGKIKEGIRLPLTPLSIIHHEPLKQALAVANIN